MKRSIPYIFIWFLLASVFILLNIEYLECLGLPFGKGDIINYMPMFAGDVDIHHALYAAQIRGLSIYSGQTIPNVFAFTILFKGFVLFPIVYFLYMCSLEGRPRISLYGTALVCLFSWLPYAHMIIGIHAQFEGFMWYLVWASCGNLKRRGANDYELDLTYWGSMMLSILYYPLTIVLFYLHYLFENRLSIKRRLLPLPFLLAFITYKTPYMTNFIVSFKTVTPYTMLLLAPLALWFLTRDGIDLNDTHGVYLTVDKTLYTFIYIGGLFTFNHRLAIYAIPYLYYQFARKPPKYSVILALALFYIWYTFDFHLTQMWYEIVAEGKVPVYCIEKILTRG